MRFNEMQVIVAAGRSLARDTQSTLDAIHLALQTSAATRLLTAIDVCHARLAASAIGIFSLYEARLQAEFGWDKPFSMLRTELCNCGRPDIAERIENYCLAINVLKHGEGASHNALLSRRSSLPFRVRATSEDFYDEGDVTPLPDLVEVTPQFLEECCSAIEDSWSRLR